MKVKKYPMDGYKANLIITNRYTSMFMTFLFEMKYTKKNIYLCDLLAEYMLNTNKFYKTGKSIYNRCNTYYNMNISIDNYHIGTQLFVEVSYTFLDPELVKDDYLNKAIKFASQMLFYPNFGEKLDSKVLKKIKNQMIESKANWLSNPINRGRIEFIKNFAPNSFLSEDLIESKEEYSELLNSFTEEDVMNMHKNILNRHFVGAYLAGNFNKEHLMTVKKYFKFNHVAKLNTNYNDFMPFDNVKDLTISSDSLSESSLIVIYKVVDYSPSKEFTYLSIEKILNYVGMLLHRVLRDEMHLVYSASAYFNIRAAYFRINASISKENMSQTLMGIEKVWDLLKDEKYLEEIIPKIKKDVQLDFYTEDENHNRVFSRMISEDCKWQPKIKKVMDSYANLTVQDIVEAVNSLKKICVFFYRGDK